MCWPQGMQTTEVTCKLENAAHIHFPLTVHSSRWYLMSSLTTWDVFAAMVTSSRLCRAGRATNRFGATTMEMFVRSILLVSLRWDTRSRNSSRRWEEGEYQTLHSMSVITLLFGTAYLLKHICSSISVSPPQLGTCDTKGILSHCERACNIHRWQNAEWVNSIFPGTRTWSIDG